jgi:hypothetical protein
MTAYLKNYIDNLRNEAAAKNEIARDVSSELKPKTYIPLKDQITELMNSLPYALRNKPWSMQELTPRLNGKYKERPHAQMVGIALRQLGWTRKRLFSAKYQGVRLWIPPKINWQKLSS